MAENRLTFPRDFLLKKQLEFNTFFSQSRRVENKLIRLYYSKKSDKQGRFAFISGKKVGKAVFRNRARRRIKEICRINQHHIDRKNDYVLVAKRHLMSESFETATDQILNLFASRSLLVKHK